MNIKASYKLVSKYLDLSIQVVFHMLVSTMSALVCILCGYVSQPYDEDEGLSSRLTAEHPEFDCDQEPEVGEYSSYYNSGPEEHNEEDQFLLPDDQLTSFDHQRQSARFILKLMEGHRLTQVAIGDVIGGCSELSMQTARQVKDSLESQIRDSGIDSSFIDLEVIDLFQDPFEGLSTLLTGEVHHGKLQLCSKFTNPISPKNAYLNDRKLCSHFIGVCVCGN